MKVAATISLAVLFWSPVVVVAQDSLPGKYSGSYQLTGVSKNPNIGVTIVITSVQDGVVKGTATRGGRSCAGDYELEGAFKDQQLDLRSTGKSGPAGDCSFRFRGTVEGNALVGKIGQADIQLRK